jgi:hypothetical protein
MGANIWFWLIYVLSLVFGGWLIWPQQAGDRRLFGSWGILFILIGILGWAEFGSPIQGGGTRTRIGLGSAYFLVHR